MVETQRKQIDHLFGCKNSLGGWGVGWLGFGLVLSNIHWQVCTCHESGFCKGILLLIRVFNGYNIIEVGWSLKT